jgi:hypothetical protein
VRRWSRPAQPAMHEQSGWRPHERPRCAGCRSGLWIGSGMGSFLSAGGWRAARRQ